MLTITEPPPAQNLLARTLPGCLGAGCVCVGGEGGSNQCVHSWCGGSLLRSLPADVRSADDVIAFTGPHHAMQVAERLYIRGYISYPRTETTAYPENFDFREVLRVHERSSDWGAEARELLHDGMVRPKRGEDKGDHPPITPMRLASDSSVTRTLLPQPP